MEDSNGKQYTFMLEDTSESCYRDVSAALVRRGWASVPFQKRLQQKKKLSQLKYGSVPGFIWAINERDIDFNELIPSQIVNHFEGIGKLTTKQGLCELLRETSWIDEDSQEICPRSYDLSQPSQRSEFTDDFRVSAACNVLKFCSMRKTLVNVPYFQDRVIRYAVTAVAVYLQINLHGDNSFMHPNGILSQIDRGDFGLLDSEWAEILHATYQMSVNENHLEWSLGEIYQRDDIALPTALQIKIRFLLRGLYSIWPQLYMDGMRNIWIVKAPVISRGTGIKLSYKLEDIFDLEKRIAGRIVQKYVETPLLFPNAHSTLSLNSNLTNQVKFDMRIWVAVTSYQPLKVFVYSTLYGRRCTKPYVYSVKHISEEVMHLTNFSIQKHSNAIISNNQDIDDNTIEDDNVLDGNVINASMTGAVSSLVEKLRVACNAAPTDSRKIMKRKQSKKSSNNSSRQDLLVTHAELLEFLNFRCNGKGNQIWEESIWPEIKYRILALILSSRNHVSHRDKSFELLGVDVILDDRLVPWILEVNMSPGLSHRNDSHNKLIAAMIESLLQKILGDNVSVPAGEKQHSVHSKKNGSNQKSLSSSFLLNSIRDSKSDISTEDGHWEPLHDLDLSQRPRWHGIAVNIPVSRFYVISGEGKINKLWVDMVKARAADRSVDELEASTSLATFNDIKRNVNIDTCGKIVKQKSYLRSKFDDMKLSALNRMAVNPALDSKQSEFHSKNVDAHKNSFNTSLTEQRWIQYNNMSQNHYDPTSCVAIGTGIKKSSIFSLDQVINTHEKVVLLQRWARRYLMRLRLYHFQRQIAAVIIQCMIRQKQAIKLRIFKFRMKAANAIQNRMRQYLSLLEFERRKKYQAATKIQSVFRIKLSKNRRNFLFRSLHADIIRKWYLALKEKWCNVAANCIIRMAKNWLQRRLRKRRIIRHLIGWYYRYRVRVASQIKRGMRRYLRYLRSKRIKRRNLLRSIMTATRKPNKGLRHVVISNIKPQLKTKTVDTKQENPSYVVSTNRAMEIVKSILGPESDPSKADSFGRSSRSDVEIKSEQQPTAIAREAHFDILDFVSKHCSSNVNNNDAGFIAAYSTLDSKVEVIKHQVPLNINAVKNCDDKLDDVYDSKLLFSKETSLADSNDLVDKNVIEGKETSHYDSIFGDNDSNDDDEVLFQNMTVADTANSKIEDVIMNKMNEQNVVMSQNIYPQFNQPNQNNQTHYIRAFDNVIRNYDVPNSLRVDNVMSDSDGSLEDIQNYKSMSKFQKKQKHKKHRTKISSAYTGSSPLEDKTSYQLQLEKQLRIAKEKYAQKQQKRAIDSARIIDHITRPDSKPFVTNINPHETAWDSKNISKGVNTKYIEKEKDASMRIAAEWDSVIAEELFRKERKQHVVNQVLDSNGAEFVNDPRANRARPKSAGTNRRTSSLPADSALLPKSDKIIEPVLPSQPKESRKKSARPKSAGSARVARVDTKGKKVDEIVTRAEKVKPVVTSYNEAQQLAESVFGNGNYLDESYISRAAQGVHHVNSSVWTKAAASQNPPSHYVPVKEYSRHDVNDSDDDDNLEVAMEKWMRKQEMRKLSKSGSLSKYQTNSRLNDDVDNIPTKFQSQRDNTNRFDFDEDPAQTRVAPVVTNLVKNGINQSTTPGVAIPTLESVRNTFTPLSELVRIREDNKRRKNAGFSDNYIKGMAYEETKAYEAMLHAKEFGDTHGNADAPLAEVTSEWSVKNNSRSVSTYGSISTQGHLKQMVNPESKQTSSSSRIEFITLQQRDFDDEPLQKSVKKLRQAYTNLNWDF